MARSIKGELVKLRTTSAFLGLVFGAIVVAALTALSTVSSAPPRSLVGPVHEQQFAFLTLLNVGLFSLILGMRAFTDEFRHKTIIQTLLGAPTRTRTLAAKVLVSALAATVLASLALVVSTALALLLASSKGGHLRITATDGVSAAGFVAANALWAAIGVGVGAVVRHQVAAIVGGIVWVLVIENLGASFFGDLGPYMPGQVAQAIAQTSQALTPLALPWAALMMSAYALTSGVFGTLLLKRRDVS